MDYQYRVTGGADQPRAHFVDAATWEAARGADRAIVDWLTEAGFEATPKGGKRGTGTKEMFETLAGRLRAGLARHPLPETQIGDAFEIGTFLQEVRRATRAGPPARSNAPRVLLAGGVIAAALAAAAMLMPQSLRDGVLQHIEQTKAAGDAPKVEVKPVGSAWTGSRPLFDNQ